MHFFSFSIATILQFNFVHDYSASRFTKRITHMLIFYQCKFVENFQERANLGLVNKCLSQGQTFDPTIFDSDESDEENAEERKKKEKENRRKKKQEEAQKKPRRHRIRGRRYYNDSDHDADESELASESEVIMPDFEAFTVPTEKNKIMPNRSKRNSKVLSEPSLSGNYLPILILNLDIKLSERCLV